MLTISATSVKSRNCQYAVSDNNQAGPYRQSLHPQQHTLLRPRDKQWRPQVAGFLGEDIHAQLQRLERTVNRLCVGAAQPAPTPARDGASLARPYHRAVAPRGCGETRSRAKLEAMPKPVGSASTARSI